MVSTPSTHRISRVTHTAKLGSSSTCPRATRSRTSRARGGSGRMQSRGAAPPATGRPTLWGEGARSGREAAGGRGLASSSAERAEKWRMSRAREPWGSRSRRRSTPPGPAKFGANCSATSRLGEALLKPLQWILRPRW